MAQNLVIGKEIYSVLGNPNVQKYLLAGATSGRTIRSVGVLLSVKAFNFKDQKTGNIITGCTFIILATNFERGDDNKGDSFVGYETKTFSLRVSNPLAVLQGFKDTDFPSLVVYETRLPSGKSGGKVQLMDLKKVSEVVKKDKSLGSSFAVDALGQLVAHVRETTPDPSQGLRAAVAAVDAAQAAKEAQAEQDEDETSV
jgi:hypothetical protein